MEFIGKNIEKWFSSLSDKKYPNEFEVKQLLNIFQITTPQGFCIKPEQQLDIKKLFSNYAVKVCSGKILHKTDQNGVILNLDKSNLDKGVSDIQSRFPGEIILVEEQINFQGIEFIVGALVDPDFGPAVMAGAGGVLTELYEDVAFRLAPCLYQDAVNMLEELSLAPVFEGFRGFDLDIKGLAEIICKAGKLAVELGDRLAQLDINPVVYSNGTWIALDAKLVMNI